VSIDVIVNGTFLTTLIGDGLIVSTPTGSTAYNMSAGGSIVQSNVPCILLTPLAPHSLSFRPMIFSEQSVIELKKTDDNRQTGAWVSLDGATRFELKPKETFTVKRSKESLGMIINQEDDLTNLFAQRVNNMLHWNNR
jgi:NAD kinase